MAVSSSARGTFVLKTAGGLLLLLLAQWLFYGQEPGGTLGVFVIGWCSALAITVPALRRGIPAAVLTLAAALALILVDDPNPLGWALCWCALASAVVLTRRRFGDAANWSMRLAALALVGLAAPLLDALALVRRSPRGVGSAGTLSGLTVLPLIGSAVFLAMFAAANPVLGRMLGAIMPPSLDDIVRHLLFWAAVLIVVWPTFRPPVVRLPDRFVRTGVSLDVPLATLTVSLVAFNLVFALQNTLDLLFLWSGAALPQGVTLAEYAHQGAYTLIVTALLAGAFVTIALPPDRAARNTAIRRLLLLWTGQNVLLVASSALRLLDYVEAYSLTTWRIAAFAWMALVAAGLILLCWRLLAGRSAAWLINANALAAALVLVVGDMVDLGAVAARWNVDHARRAEQLDLCYLRSLGASALLPLIGLERRADGPVLRDRVHYLRREIEVTLEASQSDWHQWSWRGARRLAAAHALVGRDDAPLRPSPDGRGCDGTIVPPSTPGRLTKGPAQ